MGGKLIYNEDNSFNYKDSSAFGDEITGCRCRIVNNKLIDDKHKLHQDLIDKSDHEPGDEVYIIDWHGGPNGCYEMGWIVVFDVDELISEVFKQDVVKDIIESDPKISRFLKILDEKGIRYSEDWTRID